MAQIMFSLLAQVEYSAELPMTRGIRGGGR